MMSGAGAGSGLRVDMSAKLPRLNLPHFSGKPEEWPAFWGAFCVTVHSTGLADVTKLTYLRSLLDGEVKRSPPQ